MSLSVGTRLGVYEVTGHLGAGGMGEVYRGRDTRLHREVALKILPEAFARDPDRLARFEREARVLASLNHPNIAQIFGLEESGDVRALVMELVDGESLDRVIPTGGLPLDRIVSIAGAIAAALASAHDKGIVHRDLKPANVMLTSDGRVKVLDFGLAKEVRATEPAEATFTSAGQTAMGLVMGTPAYMAPEQIAGRAVDHRADLFALGILLYEMATGRRPFAGASSAELASCILRDTPPPVTDVRTDLPPDLARIVRRCLEKDPSERLQTARDVGLDLRDLGRLASTPAAGVAARPRADASPVSGAALQDEGFRVAVLPFTHRGTEAHLDALADGLTEEIVTGLSRFPYLRVVARSATGRYAGAAVDAPLAGREIGARYVMEGNIRQAGTRLRISVRLVDTTSAGHLWAETYERVCDPAALFELQDELVPRIVSTVADLHGVLPRSMGDALRSRAPDQLTPYEAVLRSFSYMQRVTAEELAAARAGLDVAVRTAPAYADAWAMISLLSAQAYGQGFTVLDDPLATAATAARRAVETGPSNHLAHFSLAQVLFFQKDVQGFRIAAERAATLNPMDGNSIAFLGEMLVYAGDAERGLELAGRAKQLNPNHPGWYWYADFFHAYRQRDYPAALGFVRRANLPGHWGAHCAIAAVCGQLGDRETAGHAVRALLELRPDFAEVAPAEFAKWWDPQLVSHLIDGLRKAGLEVSTPPSDIVPALDSGRAPVPSGSGASRQDAGFWVAVLPLTHRGAEAGLDALAEGLSEEIVTGLSRFSYLRVIARGSTRRYSGEPADARAVGRELGARYVIEGSIRQAGSRLRTAVHLVDVSTGAHVWAENYERPFTPESIFDIQDDIVPRIVSTVADMHGVLRHSLTDAVRSRPLAELTPHEAALRGFGYFERQSAEEHAEVRTILERAVRDAPESSDCLAMLSLMYCEEYKFGYNPLPDPLDRALGTARRAVDAAPASNLAHYALAAALFFRREMQAFRYAADRAIALNPLDSHTTAFMGLLLAYSGDWDRGCALVARASELNPHHPRWYWLAPFANAYRKADYEAALDAASRINLPTWGAQVALVASHGQLGDPTSARDAVRLLLANDYFAVGRQELGKWFDRELVEHIIDGLRKAGMPFPAEPAAPAMPVHAPTTIAASVAVLPFVNTSADPDNEYFCDGLAEELINALSRVEALRVVARSSSFSFKGQTVAARDVGQRLNVGAVLEGSVRKSGTRLRITAELVRTDDGSRLWSERYDRELADVFDIQDEISLAIVEALKITLLGGEKAAILKRHTDDAEAYQLYLKGRFHYSKWTAEGLRQSVDYFQQALGKDPEYAPAFAALSITQGAAWMFGFAAPEASIAPAQAEAARALAIDASLAEAHFAAAWLAFFREWDAVSAEHEFRRAIELSPSYAEAHQQLGVVLAMTGRPAEALAAAARAMELAPLSLQNHYIVAYTSWWAGDLDGAFSQAESLVSMEPRFFGGHSLVGAGHLSRATYDAAVPALETAVSLGGGNDVLAFLGCAYGLAGRPDEAGRVLASLDARRADGISVGYYRSIVLAGLGDWDEAFAALEEAYVQREGFLVFLERLAPLVPGFAADPRMTNLLRRIGRA